MSLWFFPSAWCLAHPRLLKCSKLLCGYILNEASLLPEGAIPAVALYYFFGEHSQSLLMMINRGGDSERIWPCPTGVLVLVRYLSILTKLLFGVTGILNKCLAKSWIGFIREPCLDCHTTQYSCFDSCCIPFCFALWEIYSCSTIVTICSSIKWYRQRHCWGIFLHRITSFYMCIGLTQYQ